MQVEKENGKIGHKKKKKKMARREIKQLYWNSWRLWKKDRDVTFQRIKWKVNQADILCQDG